MSSNDIEVLVIVPVADEALSNIVAVDSRVFMSSMAAAGSTLNTVRAGRRGACGATSASIQSRSARARSVTGC